MKALVIKGVGNIALEEIEDPRIKSPGDAIVRLTMTTICGTDLHAVRGTIPDYKPGTVLGHEGVGIIEEVGSSVKNFSKGDRVIVPSTIFCGDCFYCKKEIYAQCDNANPKGPNSGAAYYGGPKGSGSFNGMQAEKVRVPYADASLIRIPKSLKDEQVILLSDILPTSYMAIENCNPKKGDVVAVFGCGIVGQLAILCLKQMGIKEIYAIDRISSRLEMAKKQGAQIINFDKVDPEKALKKINNKRGPNKIIDAVGIDAEHPYGTSKHVKDFKKEVKKIAPKMNPQGKNWIPGNGPSQVFRWAVPAIAKAGTISIIGVYTEKLNSFPIGEAMGKNLTITMGDCNHRQYIPKLLKWVESGKVDLTQFLTKHGPFYEIVDAYKRFDRREDGWLKVALKIR